jgi:large subunit ribosomal protein L15
VHGFEGGQMPLHMRMPKRGFRNIFANDFSEVNLNRIQRAIDEKRLSPSEKITEEVLRKAGLAHKSRDGVRLLGKGAITAKIEIEVAGASSSAKAAVEKAGGSVTTTFQKKVYSNKKGQPGKRQTRRAESAKKREARKA